MKRGLMIAALPLVLGGCLPILPPAIQLASTGLSGVAFLATGKSTTDHLLSAAADEDCSLMRVAFGDHPCRAYENAAEKPLTELVAYYPGDGDDWVDQEFIPEGHVSGTTMLSLETVANPDASETTFEDPSVQKPVFVAVENVTGKEEEAAEFPGSFDASLETFDRLGVSGFAPLKANFDLEPVTVEGASENVVLPVSALGSWKLKSEDVILEPMFEPAVQPDSMSVLPVLRPSQKKSDKHAEVLTEDHFVMLGSFKKRGRAEELKEKVAAKPSAETVLPAPVIMSVRLRGSLWHRVAVGPFTGGEAVTMASSLEPIFGKKPWAAKIAD